MSTKTFLLTLLVLLSTVFATTNSWTQDNSAKWKPLVQAVEDVLAGKPISDTLITISPGAYLATGNQWEALLAVARGESKTCSLKEAPTRASVAIRLKINDSEDAAFLTLKTQTANETEPRYHTVMFMKDSSNVWVIEAWHASQ
jgi:hypothetical protein